MSSDALEEFVEAKAKEFDVPGIAAGVWVEGREVLACHGRRGERYGQDAAPHGT